LGRDELDDGEGEVEAVCYGGYAGGGGGWSVSLSCGRGVCWRDGQKYRFTPPSSGLTITAFETVQFSLIHLRVLGSAYCNTLAMLKLGLAMAGGVMTHQVIDRY